MRFRLEPSLRTSLAACLVALAAPAPRAGASPQDLFGYGNRSAALAGTGTSFASSYDAAYLNPARLSAAHRRAFALGIHAAAFGLRVGDERFAVDPARANLIGVVLPLPLGGLLRDRITLGAGFYTPHAVVVRGQVLRPDEPQFPVLQYRAQSVALMVGMGVGPIAGFRFGFGFSALASLVGDMRVALNAEGRFGSTVETQLLASYAPILGASYGNGPWRIGAVFRGTLDARFDFFVVTQDLPVRLPPLTVGGVAQWDPPQAAVEGAWEHDDWLVAAQLGFKAWSAYPGTQQRTSETSNPPPPPDFSSTLVPRVAVERRLHPTRGSLVALRAGYWWEPSPAPPGRDGVLLFDGDRHVLSLGAGLDLPVAGELRLRFDAHMQLHWLPEREHDALDASGRALTTSGFVAAGGWSVEASW